MDVILKADSLKKQYGNITAVDSISFEVYSGEIFGFLGPNGAGKTTSMKMLSGLLKPDSGKVILNCENNKSIGVCPQNIVIWDNLTCLEQLIYMGKMHNIPVREAAKNAKALLEALALLEKKDKLARTLSGGMQRRLNIALALIHAPAIVLLDEPQAGLDPQSRLLVRDYIRSIKNKTTVILTTHDMEEAEKLSDRVCIIDKGKILAVGTTGEIKKINSQEDLIEIEIAGNIRNTLIPYLKIQTKDYTITSENCAHFKINDPYSTFEDILGVVRKQNIQVHDLRLRKTSLEDIFINMTGRSLRE